MDERTLLALVVFKSLYALEGRSAGNKFVRKVAFVLLVAFVHLTVSSVRFAYAREVLALRGDRWDTINMGRSGSIDRTYPSPKPF